MKIKSNRESTTISLGKAYCYNFDKVIDASIYLSAKEYFYNGGGIGQMQVYSPKGKCYSVDMYREYKRLKFALQRFEGMSEEDIFDGVAYGYKKGGWDFDSQRNQHRYNKTIETLFNSRFMMWN